MALVTKIKLTPAYDWKSILLEDITGTGITGYGANQDPVNFRKASAINVDIQKTNIYITSPSNVNDTIELNATAAYNLLLNSKTISNLDLGFLTDEPLTDGIWKIDYVPFFEEPNSNCLTFVNQNTASFFAYNKLHFINATKIYSLTDDNYLTITNIDFVNNKITFAENITSFDFANILIGIGTTTYTAFTKEIKECLDNKIADITNCECENVDCELVNKYLLYDAMYVNCKENNVTKAQQIFNLLTTYCTDNCGC